MNCIVKGYQTEVISEAATAIQRDLQTLGEQYKISHVSACGGGTYSSVKILVVYEKVR